jgi:asparagine synthetase B (glutamine-hydrolysing)
MKMVNFSHTTDPFSMRFDRITRPVQSWRREMTNTVNSIAVSTHRPIVLCFSGGIDSEVIALSLIENNIPFTVLTVKQKNNINRYDTKWADDFCKKYNIEQKIVAFDPDDFWSNQIQKYREQGLISWRPWRYFQIYLI